MLSDLSVGNSATLLIDRCVADGHTRYIRPEEHYEELHLHLCSQHTAELSTDLQFTAADSARRSAVFRGMLISQ